MNIRGKGNDAMELAGKQSAESPTDDRSRGGLAEELTFLFVNTVDPKGRPWSLQTVVDEAARYGEHLSRSYVAMLLKGRIANPTVHKVQILGMVFGVGSMGLIHPLESEVNNRQEQESATQKVLQDLHKRSGLVEKALTNAKLQRAVLLLSDFQDQTTVEQAARIIEELGEMEKRFLAANRKAAES